MAIVIFVLLFFFCFFFVFLFVFSFLGGLNVTRNIQHESSVCILRKILTQTKQQQCRKSGGQAGRQRQAEEEAGRQQDGGWDTAKKITANPNER